MTQEETPGPQALEQRLRWLLTTIDSVDLEAPEAAASALEERHPLDGEELRTLGTLLRAGLDEGWIVLNELHPGLRQGVVAPELGAYAVTAVLIEGAGRGHTHPEGEVCLAFPWEGEPCAEGHGPGWVVYPPGSHHVPEVEGGRMLMLLFRPHGEVVWDALPT